ncbi:serine hydrolase domain-containing protein [Terricaulis sp.]|uniref:serine hydrolase domain-containing protein n=1 Tax=Terricaulis sp. TaxID=2768686 RepID=UPI00378505E2
MQPTTRRRFLAGAASTPLITLSTGARAAELDRRLDAYLAPYVASKDFAGVVLIKRGARVLARRAYGDAAMAGGANNRLNSKFGIESVSKLITSACLYSLRTRGMLSFDDRLSRFLPDFPRADDINLTMLMQHRSGLARDLSNFETARQTPRTLEQLTPLVAREGFVTEPGQNSGYSNNGYRVLGRVIEIASGESYHEAAARLVLRPHGMRNTGPLFGPHVRGLSHACTVGADPRSLRTPLPLDLSNWQGAASFYSTADDLARFMDNYPPRALETPPGPRDKFGHDGFGHGYMAMAYRYPESDTIIIVTGNIESGLFQPLQSDLEAIAFGETTSAPSPPLEVPGAAGELTRFAGRYGLGPGRSMEMAVVDGRLAANAGDGFTALWPIAPNRFFSRLRYATLTFVESDGAIARVDWSEGGGTFPCPRLPD